MAEVDQGDPVRGSSLRRVALNSSALLVAQVAARLLALVVVVLMGRWYGPEDLGRYTVAMTLFTFLDVVTDFGLRPLLMRDVARAPESGRSYGRAALGLKVRLALVGGGLAALLAPLVYDGETTLLVWIALVALAPNLVLATVKALFLALEGMHLEALLVLGQQGSYALGTIVLLALGAPLWVVVSWFVATLAVAALVAVSVWRRWWPMREPAPAAAAGPTWRQLARQAAPFALTAFFGLAYFKIDILMLEAFRGSREVGTYSMAYRFVEALMFVSISLMSALYPAYGRLYHKADREGLAGMHETVAGLLAVLGTGLAVALLVIVPPLVPSLLGPKFAETLEVLPYLAVALGLVTFNSAFVTLVNACDRAARVTRATAWSLGFNVAANLVALPWWGQRGAAVSTILSEVVLLSCLALDARRELALGLPWGRLWRGPLTGALVAVLWWWWSGERWVVGLGALALYGLVVVLLGPLDRRRLDQLNLILRRS